ncbi:unnamed protein product [Nippostrongylus brasiliensis]|uniref:Cystatin domain-containing protein n=1 Tax=Nippostrongylus brasiliensis TaxID=27835 RepID=A0A0N4XX70_NIPBR|nr:unnamed protein product [Nippostrongylus brasiliensis]
MKWLFVLLLVVVVLFVINECATIGKKVNVPDSDRTLQDLIYRSAVPKSNEQLHDRVWWVPSGGHYQATKVSVMNAGKLYSTYAFQMVLQKSQCDVYKTPTASLPKCKPIASSPKVGCHVTLAWTDGDWTSIEIESYCSKQ